MKFLSLATLFALTVTTNAACYNDDTPSIPVLYDKNKAYQAARDACHEFQGSYRPGLQYKYKCDLDKEGKGYKIWVMHVKSGKRDLDVTECYNGLSKEIHGCERGGISEYDNWKYSIAATRSCENSKPWP